MKIDRIQEDFRTRFESSPEAVYFAPGRVNLIGEHIDYNGGRVLPAAINAGTYFAVARNGLDRARVYSTLFGEEASVELAELLDIRASGHWSDYSNGMLRKLLEMAGSLAGVDVLVTSDLPQSSGLSSSASFSVGIGFALNELLSLDIDRLELAKAAQSVENDFVGVSCGIMDQFAVAMGKADHCILLDCDTLAHELLPMNLAGNEIVIANSMVPRKLAASKYNQRRSECKQALKILQRSYPVEQLCDLSIEQVEPCHALREVDVLYRRARHCVSENQRVHDSVFALKEGRLKEFGLLMNASHDSLRDDYEVSCRELDLLVDTALALPGIIGSRMTGAGFGGCTVSIVDSSAVPEFSARLAEIYARDTGLKTEILSGKPSDGAKRIA